MEAALVDLRGKPAAQAARLHTRRQLEAVYAETYMRELRRMQESGELQRMREAAAKT